MTIAAKLGRGVTLGFDGVAKLPAKTILYRFMALQFFCLIYLQTFGVPIGGAQSLSIPMLVIFASIAAQALFTSLPIDRNRLAVFCCFLAAASTSQLIACWSGSTPLPSVPSFAQLVLLYAMMTIRWPADDQERSQIYQFFNDLMVVPCLIIIFQLIWQVLTGRGNPLNIHALVPERFLLQGFIYQAPYHWGESFIRPNGFFFLETSFASTFAAAAAIIEMTCRRRPGRILLYVAATLASLGGTGVTMLLVAAPFILVRQRWHVILAAVAVVSGVIFVPLMGGVDLPFVSRLQEFDSSNSSASGRLLLPALQLLEILKDPRYIGAGLGAGAASSHAISVWPIVKLAQEYGLLTMVAFILLFIVCLSRTENITLTAALCVTFQFTGGYLLNPVLIELFILLCTFHSSPVPRHRDNPAKPLLALRQASGAR